MRITCKAKKMTFYTRNSFYLPSADVKDSANPYGRVGMLVCVLSKLGRRDDEDDSI